MKTTLFILFISITSGFLYGQNAEIQFSISYDSENNDKFLKDQNIIQPDYNGGLAKIENYLKDNMTYSKKDKKYGLAGRNYVQLKIGTDGNVLNASFIKATVPYQVTTKIQKLLLNCNDWAPATNEGKPTEVYLWLIIDFETI